MGPRARNRGPSEAEAEARMDRTANSASNFRHGTALDAFRAEVRDAGPSRAIRYFDGRMTYLDLDRDSDAVAATLEASRVAPGDRIALCL